MYTELLRNYLTLGQNTYYIPAPGDVLGIVGVHLNGQRYMVEISVHLSGQVSSVVSVHLSGQEKGEVNGNRKNFL